MTIKHKHHDVFGENGMRIRLLLADIQKVFLFPVIVVFMAVSWFWIDHLRHEIEVVEVKITQLRAEVIEHHKMPGHPEMYKVGAALEERMTALQKRMDKLEK